MEQTKQANQYTPDKREQICWDFYVESITKGQPNAYESAIKAGYSEDHARNITLQGWFKERLEDLDRKDMLSKAEKKLAKTLTYEVEDTETGKVQTDLLRIQVDVSKHLTSTLGKDKGYSSRTEQTGKDGKDLIPPTLSEEEKDKLNKLL
jgi:phage terminase small subunit